MKACRALAALTGGLLACLLPLAAVAAVDPVNDAKLLAGARAEGSVTLYTSVSIKDSTALAKRFEAQYGVPVHVLRMESNQLPARLLIESHAARANADVVLAPTLQMYALKAASILTRQRVPEEAMFLPKTVDRDGAFGGLLINTDTIVFNPKLLADAHMRAPQNWADLARPEWRGKFALYKFSYEWYLGMKTVLGAGPAQTLMRALAANQPHLVASHQLAINQTIAGEYDGAANAFAYDALRQKKLGAAIDFVSAAPTIAEVNAVGITQQAAHPLAALLFERWALSRPTQQYIVSVLGRASGRTDVRPDPAIWNGHLRLVISDPSSAGDYREASAEFDRIFSAP